MAIPRIKLEYIYIVRYNTPVNLINIVRYIKYQYKIKNKGNNKNESSKENGVIITGDGCWNRLFRHQRCTVNF